ncbi:MAG: Slp family lipoprotein [Halorhodospira sp.]
MARRILVLALALWWLIGCAGSVPEAVRSAPEGAPSLERVRAAPQAHEGETVRWGGEVAEVRNEAEATWLEIVQRPLGRHGEPRRREDRSEGRFLARVDGFLEPTTYAPGRRVTVMGQIDGTVDGTIGEYDYRYPVVAVAERHLWPVKQVPAARPPSGYDPWYAPWYSPWYYGPRYPGYDGGPYW